MTIELHFEKRGRVEPSSVQSKENRDREKKGEVEVMDQDLTPRTDLISGQGP